MADKEDSVKFRVGLAARLTTAFCAVAVLAAVATLLSGALQSVESNEARRLVWITAAVVLLLIVVVAGRLLSIARPVRHLISAASQLALGDYEVRVPRGGGKELDTLAAAFNQMAEQLAVAQDIMRDHRARLDIEVAGRTHELQQLADIDPLTMLPNRRRLFAMVDEAIAKAKDSGRHVGLFFIDLDNFKSVNDSLGHAFGDRVLVAIADHLRDACKNIGFAARLGGDEFTVVYESAVSVEEMRAAGWDLVRAFRVPLNVENRKLMISVSIGASFFPEHERSAESLLSSADAALFRAKALGRCQLNVFTPDLLELVSSKFSTEQGLRRALNQSEFELLYQPEIGADTLEVIRVEALLRWRRPDGRIAAPGEFLCIAEESGLITEMSDWVLESAIKTAANWHHGEWPQARVAINVSPRQLLDSRFVDRVMGLLETYRLPPRCIEIELTEIVLQAGPATLDALRKLASNGIAIALDDFGMGYSSLSALEQLPLARIKLDRSLISGIDSNGRSAAIAEAMIGLCKNLGLEITAEGVERPAQLAKLLKYPSITLQGYLLALPLAKDAVAAAIKTIHQHMHGLLLSAPAQLRATVEDAGPSSQARRA